MIYSDKHRNWLKFGPKHHPLHHEKLGNENGQVKFKTGRWEMGGKIVGPPRSRKNRARTGR